MNIEIFAAEKPVVAVNRCNSTVRGCVTAHTVLSHAGAVGRRCWVLPACPGRATVGRSRGVVSCAGRVPAGGAPRPVGAAAVGLGHGRVGAGQVHLIGADVPGVDSHGACDGSVIFLSPSSLDEANARTSPAAILAAFRTSTCTRIRLEAREKDSSASARRTTKVRTEMDISRLDVT